MEPTREQRKYPRYLVHVKSIFSTDGVRLEDGLVLDLSLGGCRLMSTRNLTSGSPIELHLRPDQHTPVYIPRAVVCWARNSTLGVQFNEISELELATLTRLIWTLRS